MIIYSRTVGKSKLFISLCQGAIGSMLGSEAGSSGQVVVGSSGGHLVGDTLGWGIHVIFIPRWQSNKYTTRLTLKGEAGADLVRSRTRRVVEALGVEGETKRGADTRATRA